MLWARFGHGMDIKHNERDDLNFSEKGICEAKLISVL